MRFWLLWRFHIPVGRINDNLKYMVCKEEREYSICIPRIDGKREMYLGLEIRAGEWDKWPGTLLNRCCFWAKCSIKDRIGLHAFWHLDCDN